ncbi:MAG: methyltransferase domain-containing protein [Arthrobacter sp.]|uniref:methyltransferase domain-containing protein n=1 Tax=Arthrobacter sp. TaxID=1667 RepID=UPI00348BEE64
MRDAYDAMAPFYDAFSGEYPVYRAGRLAGFAGLCPDPGARVLDAGCGTGLNFGPLLGRLGPGGAVVGIDRSAGMLRRAERRAAAQGWDNIVLVQADLETVGPDRIAALLDSAGAGSGAARAGLATYSLSVMPGWRRAWEHLAGGLGEGARLCVVDMQRPVGRARWLAPLAEAACALGGSDITAHPWTAVEERCRDVGGASVRGGHVQARWGTLPAASRGSPDRTRDRAEPGRRGPRGRG